MKAFNFPDIKPVATSLESALMEKINNKTKPLGSLGILETLALQLGLIQNSPSPTVDKPKMLVFAGDNGVAVQGVSPFPQEVTQQMVLNFLAGGAAVSVFCQQHNVPLQVVDVGVNAELATVPLLTNHKVGMGTKDFSVSPAMTEAEFLLALGAGVKEVDLAHSEGKNILLFGEMGIGNTTIGAALMSALLSKPVKECVGAGAGSTTAGIEKKIAVIETAFTRIEAFYQQPITDLSPEVIAQELAGFEVVAMAGAMLRSAELGIAYVIDGFICTAALLLASKLNPHVVDYGIFAHQSHEKAHLALLAHFKAKPILSLSMRLGEGSGAIVALPIIQSATVFLNNMASFESAGVSEGL
ncbi:nicotinate-nucleotide--dimethylbenzimidazole phosphoribosyltransferase [Marinomonas sp. 15G1-11]|uniref:Nicotinate-nucleotide--dimethylbenzimidazole phosphoribosyltransferase n=1 Tax=Marinomonas phaeophyticola TaxID=3004091 RepID=A0ABT4JY59_9GAMM|nr:nicotinate-nucleotide--dimethylbenzimidazole phosphoribosyltransferase [Marinomonas sp. 15G1-11]MCZ2722718.1 nicotinate-nucleotide--dimethylbenzimidazole phosphoribosyltransferase [Marinomonas sp. 15G1-11]